MQLGNEVELKIIQPTQRCVMTTLAQVDLPNDINVLKTLVRENNGNFGVYAEIKRPGHLKVGDEMNIQ
ncbi:MOSC domain-containing protein [Pseudogracilibacillus sp. SE30717A]